MPRLPPHAQAAHPKGRSEAEQGAKRPCAAENGGYNARRCGGGLSPAFVIVFADCRARVRSRRVTIARALTLALTCL